MQNNQWLNSRMSEFLPIREELLPRGGGVKIRITTGGGELRENISKQL